MNHSLLPDAIPLSPKCAPSIATWPWHPFLYSPLTGTKTLLKVLPEFSHVKQCLFQPFPSIALKFNVLPGHLMWVIFINVYLLLCSLCRTASSLRVRTEGFSSTPDAQPLAQMYRLNTHTSEETYEENRQVWERTWDLAI